MSKYLVPAFEMMPIQNLAAERIERWQAEMPQQLAEIKKQLASLRARHEEARKLIEAQRRAGDLTDVEAELHYLTTEQVKDPLRTGRPRLGGPVPAHGLLLPPNRRGPPGSWQTSGKHEHPKRAKTGENGPKPKCD